MDLVRTLVNLILLILLIFLVFFGYKYMQELYPEKMQNISIKDYFNQESYKLPEVYNLSGEAVLFYPNLRFNHNAISFYINSNCNEDKTNRMLEAFMIISNETEIITFYPSSEENSDILVGCSEDSYETEESVFIAGEGGPTRIINSTYYPIIEKGKISLYENSECDFPITELHELLHVLGFEHLNNTKSIMYPYLSCEQKLDREMITILKSLYSIEPLPEIYFINASGLKFSSFGINYLNFSIEIKNEGLIETRNIILKVSADNKEIDSFDLKNIDFGEGKSFEVSFLRLPSKNADTIKFELITDSEEYDKNNNIIELRG